jgi:hypothetical protein
MSRTFKKILKASCFFISLGIGFTCKSFGYESLIVYILGIYVGAVIFWID